MMARILVVDRGKRVANNSVPAKSPRFGHRAAGQARAMGDRSGEVFASYHISRRCDRRLHLDDFALQSGDDASCLRTRPSIAAN